MNKDNKPMAEKILDHTLEIIYLLTGEDCIVVKKHGEHVTDSSRPCVPEGFCRSQRPDMDHPTNSLIHERSNDKKLMSEKILELTNKIIHLLTGEVPIKCDDVAVYFSMEEWEYLEGHRVSYKNMMENLQNLSSLDGSMSSNTPAECHTPLCSPECVKEENSVITSDQGENCLRRIKPSKRRRNTVRTMAKESTSWEEGNLTASHIYTPREHTGTEYAATHIKERDKGHANAQTIHKNLSVMKYESSECGENFNSETAYTIHQIKHTTVKLYKCSECQKCFTAKSLLVRHQIIHTGEKPFVCSECGKCFNRNSSLVIHQRIHTGAKPFVCSVCGKCYKTNFYLIQHQKLHRGEKSFLCSECKICFSSKGDLNRHRRNHTGEKPFVCSECGKCFTRNSSFLTHQRLHAGAKSFLCSECGKGYNRKMYLILHQKIHRGEKSFLCSECEISFSCKGDLTRHRRIHTGEKPFVCSVCGKCFNRNYRLVEHQRSHTEEKHVPYSD